MAHIISAQEFRDEAVVAEKIANQDFTVFLSPVFEIDGEEYQVVLDGHHSYQAAIEAGVEPDFEVQTATQNDTIGLLNAGNIEDFLTANVVDSEYRHIATGAYVW
ncbi:hypothetical protein FB480_101872 [Agrobacterium vitis]|nr:hypothetical protein FB480_101872 [Agrobacterium vitis]